MRSTIFFEPIDARVYVAVRVTYAVVTLANLLEIWPVRRILLGSDGMLARPPWLAWYLPLRWITSDAGVTAFMVSVGICAVFMAVGFLTRLSALVLYLWAVSYEVAMNPATAGYDALIRIGVRRHPRPAGAPLRGGRLAVRAGPLDAAALRASPPAVAARRRLYRDGVAESARSLLAERPAARVLFHVRLFARAQPRVGRTGDASAPS